nr:P-loop NTPase [Propionibacterium sp.]
MTEPATPVLLTAAEPISDAVLAAAAALGVAVDVVTDPAECVARWPDAAAVLVGEDQAAALASRALRERRGVYLVGFSPGDLGRWSVPLGGQVVVLPEGLAALTAVLSEQRGSRGRVIGVIGGSGGVGASTLAAGLAMATSRRGPTVALVDLDPWGGGLDLLVGAERTPGWRWPDLVGARGEVTDIRRFLPQVDGLTLVAMGRQGASDPAGEPPAVEAVRAVLGSLARHHDVVFVDAGRGRLALGRAALAACRSTVLLAGTSVRAVAAAASLVPTLDGEVRLAVRAGAAGR